jgi:hypothetical protein
MAALGKLKINANDDETITPLFGMPYIFVGMFRQ